MKGELVKVKWTDSYGVTTGWQDVSDYKADKIEVVSAGTIIYENDDVVSLAHNYAEATDDTPEQANGIMVIPKVCITEVTSFSSLSSASCQGLASTGKQKMT